VLDASWAKAEHRAHAAAVAGASHSEVVAIECECPADVADARIERRATLGRDASDATVEVRAVMATTFDPWPEALRVDTSSAVDLELLPAGVRP